MVTEALAVRESTPQAIAPRSLDEMIVLAERLASSSLLPKELRGKVPEVLMQIMAGGELGLYPMASLRSFHVIEGKPTMSADAMVAIVLGSGKCEYFRRVGEGSADSVTYETKRRGEQPQRCTWTKQMAKEAGLFPIKDNWRLYPRPMLASRAKAELARDVYPDVLAGCYTMDEIDQGAPEGERVSVARHDDVQDAEFVETPAPFNAAEYPELVEITEAPSEEKCKEIAGRFATRKLQPGHPAYDTMRALYKDRITWLKGFAAIAAKADEVRAKANPTKPPASAASSSDGGATSPTSEGSSSASTGEV